MDREIQYDESGNPIGVRIGYGRKASSSRSNPLDIIYINASGIITRIEKNDNLNIFVMEDHSQVLQFNDKNGVDKGYSNMEWQPGDRVFYVISDEELLSALKAAGKGNWFNVAFKSHGSADFTMTFLVRNYFQGSDISALEDGALRTHYQEDAYFFKFGNDHRIFNLYDAGNFMWGAWMAHSGFTAFSAKIGSETNEFGLDVEADQKAIRAGYTFIREKRQ